MPEALISFIFTSLRIKKKKPTENTPVLQMWSKCVKGNAVPYVLCVQQDFLHIQLKTLM